MRGGKREGAGRKPLDFKKNIMITFRVNSEEKEKIKEFVKKLRQEKKEVENERTRDYATNSDCP